MSALAPGTDGPRGRSPGSPALVDADRAAELTAASAGWAALTLTPAQLADLELLLLGAFGRMPGYAEHTLRDDLRTPMLAVPVDAVKGIEPGDDVALRDSDGTLIAALHVRAACPAGAHDDHAVDDAGPGQVRLTGRVEGLRLPPHPDYRGLRLRPVELRALLLERAWVQPGGRPPWAVWVDGLLHTADIARIRALTRQGKHCVVLAPTGGADPADPWHHLRVRALRAALDALDEPVRATEATLADAALAAEATRGAAAPLPPPAAEHRAPRAPDAQPARALLVLVPVVPSAELAAPREPGITATSPFGAPAGDPDTPSRLAELTTLRAHVAEFYGLGGSITGPALGAPDRVELSAMLAAGRPIPAELTPSGVAAELARAYPPRHRRGFAVLLTGPPGPGRPALARLLAVRLLERGDRHVTLLDAAAMTRHSSGGPGLRSADRDRELVVVSAEIAAAGGIAVCAPAAPPTTAGAWARDLAGGVGLVLVHVGVPPAEAGMADREAAARAARLRGPADADAGGDPAGAEVTVDLARLTPAAAVDAVLAHLHAEGWLLS